MRDWDNRRRLVLRVCEPDLRNPWTWFLCGVLGIHQLAPTIEEATYIYSPDGKLRGMMCERCGGLMDYGLP